MTTLVFQRTRETMKSFVSRLLQKKTLWLYAKVLFLVGWFFLNATLYLLYLNLSSTQGYWYRQAKQELQTLQNDFDLMKLDLGKEKKGVWDDIQDVQIVSLGDVAHRVTVSEGDIYPEIVLQQ